MSDKQPKRGFVQWLWDWAKSIAFALVVWLFLRTFLIGPSGFPPAAWRTLC
jgi:hypothetical protein